MSQTPEQLISYSSYSDFYHHPPPYHLFSVWGLDLFFFSVYLLSLSHYNFPLLSLLAFTPPAWFLKSFRTSASELCLALISYCQAFVFDHRSSVSTLLLLLSTSFPLQFFWLPTHTGLCACVYLCAFLMCHAECLYRHPDNLVSELVWMYTTVVVCLLWNNLFVFVLMIDNKWFLSLCSDMIIYENMKHRGYQLFQRGQFINGWMAHCEHQEKSVLIIVNDLK